MKNIYKLVSIAILFVLCQDAFSQILLNEDFSDGPSTYTTGNYTYDSGNTWELSAIQGENDARFQLNTSAYIISPEVNHVGTVSFKFKEGNSGGGSFKLSISVDGGSFSDLDERVFSGTTFSDYSFVVNNLSDNCRIKVYANAGSQLIIDDFEITEYVEGAELLTSTSTLSGFGYYEGEGPSSTKFFNLSGTLLTGYPGNISVSAPTNYEISLDEISFSSSLSVPFSSANLSATTIYVRLKSGLSLGNYNENISISGGGADDIYVLCSGSVTEMPPPAIYVTPENLSGFSYVFGTGPSSSQSYQLYGNYLTDYPNEIVVSAPSSYEISIDNVSFSSSLEVSYDSNTLPSTSIYVRLKSGLSIGDYNAEIITNLSASYGTETVSCSGTVEDLPPDPTLYLSPSTLSDFSYIVGNGPSDEQFYMLSGANLSGYPGSISVTAPTNYEISLSSGSGFSSSLLVDFSSASFTDYIYVRLKSGLSEGDYDGELILHSGGDADEVNLSCNGTVNPVPPPELSTNPSSLSGFSYVFADGPSSEQSYILSGANLSGYPSDIIVTAPTNYEISLSSGSGYTGSLSIPYSSNTLANTTIYVRLKSGLSIGNYDSENISNLGGGAATENVICSGEVTDVPPPVLNIVPDELSNFSYTEGAGPSAQQSYSLSGSYLTGFPDDIIVTAPTHYEISLDPLSGYTGVINIAYNSATLSSTTIYVRLKSGLAVGTYNSELIVNSGGGATDVELACNGSVLAVSDDPCLEEDFSGFTDGSHASPGSVDLSGSMDSYTLTSGWEGYKVFSAGGEVKLGSSSYQGYVITPTIDLSSGGTLNFDYAKYGSDNVLVQVFHASDGENFIQLGSDITPDVDFDTHSLEITDGTTDSKIKISTTNKRIYLDNIEVYCGASIPTPILQTSPTSLSGFNYVEGSGPSTEQNFELSGTDLDGTDVSISPSSNYEISLSSGSAYQSTPIILSTYDGGSTTVYVRLKSDLDFGDYSSEQIVISGGGATEINVSCSGSVDELLIPELSVDVDVLDGFNYVLGNGPSQVQSFILSGVNLDDSQLNIVPPENYEISLSEASGYVSDQIIQNHFDGNPLSIYVRLKAGLSVGTYENENLIISGSGAPSIHVICNGFVDDNVNLNELNSTNVTIYPNPSDGIVHVYYSKSYEKIIWSLIDMSGKILKTDEVSNLSGEFKINFSDLDVGFYFLIISDGQHYYSRKLEKN
jgi:hypothetical protein